MRQETGRATTRFIAIRLLAAATAAQSLIGLSAIVLGMFGDAQVDWPSVPYGVVTLWLLGVLSTSAIAFVFVLEKHEPRLELTVLGRQLVPTGILVVIAVNVLFSFVIWVEEKLGTSVFAPNDPRLFFYGVMTVMIAWAGCVVSLGTTVEPLRGVIVKETEDTKMQIGEDEVQVRGVQEDARK